MNYDDQKLKAYLLGELSDADTEVFDELGFTDEKFADRLSAAENDLIGAYLQNELTGAELKKIESVYLATEHRREKIEFARALQTFAAKEIANTQTSVQKGGIFALWHVFKNQNRALRFGFAVVIFALVSGIVWFAVLRNKVSNDETAMQKTPMPEAVAPKNENSSNGEISPAIENPANDVAENPNQKLPSDNSQISNAGKNRNKPDKTPENRSKDSASNTPKQIIATFFLAPPTRSATKITLFDVPKNASQINVELQLEADDYAAYHVTLTNETGDINLWRRGSLKAKTKGASKVLSVSFPAKLLSNGFYSLTVSGINRNGEAEAVASYPFRAGGK